jgi:hypothetical protein
MSWFVGDLQAAAYAETLSRYAVPGPLLDLGCGAVPLYGMYRDLASDITCVDWPAGGHGGTHVDVFADLDSDDLQLPVGPYATIIATDVLEHLQHPERLLRRAADALQRPGGRVLVGVPFMYWIHEEPHDYHRYTEYRLQSLCQDAGLRVIHLEPYGGPVHVALDLALKFLARRPFIAQALVPLAHALAASRMARRMNARRSPLGYVVMAETG